MAEAYDIAVIGGGIAGLSVAASLAPEARVVVLEAEAQPGYHATGRSAAILAQNYGSDTIRALTAVAEPFLSSPPPGFAEAPLLAPRGLMRIARVDQVARLRGHFDEMRQQTELRWLDRAGAEALVPLLRPGHVAAAFLNPAAADIDVHGLMQGYLRQMRTAGGALLTSAEVTGMRRAAGHWHLTSAVGQITAPVVVNAAGAWADNVAALAGVASIGLQPLRRSAVTFAAPEGTDLVALPMLVDADEAFYLKPEAGRLMASPGDETLVAPGDVRPEELDIALAVDRVSQAFALDVRRIEASWAGLRSFVADRAPVMGFDAGAAGFYWLAAQGGYGVQTAPALARLAADEILDRPEAQRLAVPGLAPGALAPGRVQKTEKTKKTATGSGPR